MMLLRSLLIALALLLGAPAAPIHAQQRTQADEHAGARAEELEQLQAKALAAIEARDYSRARQLLGQQIELEPNSFIPHYNLACVLSLSGDAAGACEALASAVERGFVDVYHLRRDPDLAAARDHPDCRRLLDSWPAILDAHLEANLAQAQRIVEGRERPYLASRDERLRIAWLSAMDQTSSEQARADIAHLYDWGVAHVFSDMADPQEARYDAWVLIVLPSPRDFLRWTVAVFGPAAASGTAGIGGLYDHDLRRLIAQDLGPTLRHEFFHVLHWRSMVRLGQTHPIWIQEGLCSLVEEYELDGEAIRPVASWRTNIVKRMTASGRLPPLRRLASMPRDSFTGSTALANYAQARTFFLFLHDSGKLKEWYAAYTSDFDADPTGLGAVEKVFAAPLDEIERRYRQWIRDLPQVAEQIRPGAATLGLDVDPGTGDGPVIVGIPPERRAAMRQAGLRTGDVITAINGRATRDLNELVRILGEHEAGEEVEVSYRRGRSHLSARIVLVRR
jgi:hypothetical protein